MLRVDILSLFPKYFRGPFDESILKRAQEHQLVSINLVDMRDFANNKHRKVDDRPYGGGPGMVIMPEPVVNAIRSVKTEKSKVIYLSPQGKKLDHNLAKELAECEHLVLVCGHYEGIDQRALSLEVHDEVSIGDYVLTNGCLAAIVLLDVVARFVPGVLGNEDAAFQDSFENGLLDCPHYTRPPVFEGLEVPQELMNGNHAVIKEWRYQQSLMKTKQQRSDLLS